MVEIILNFLNFLFSGIAWRVIDFTSNRSLSKREKSLSPFQIEADEPKITSKFENFPIEAETIYTQETYMKIKKILSKSKPYKKDKRKTFVFCAIISVIFVIAVLVYFVIEDFHTIVHTTWDGYNIFSAIVNISLLIGFMLFWSIVIMLVFSARDVRLAVRYKAYKEFMQGKTVYQFFQDHFTITYSYNPTFDTCERKKAHLPLINTRDSGFLKCVKMSQYFSRF